MDTRNERASRIKPKRLEKVAAESNVSASALKRRYDVRKFRREFSADDGPLTANGRNAYD
jgi:hypothetical protein